MGVSATKPCPTCGGPKQRGADYCKKCRDSSGAHPPSQSFRITGNKGEVTFGANRRILNEKDLLAYCKIDSTVWRIDKFICNKWEMGSLNRTRQPQVTPLFQVKVWLSRKIELITAAAEIAALKATASRDFERTVKSYAQRTSIVKRAGVDDNLLVELSIPDLHAGKLAWAKETGYANYDTKLAIAAYKEAIETLMSRVGSFDRIGHILVPLGNDLFNADNIRGTTTGGTQQDADVRFFKTFYQTRVMLVQELLRLSQIAPVTVLTVPGNHDRQTAWHLGDSLECRFYDNRRISINNHPTLRKYFQWRKVMLMFMHGNTGKREDYPLLMATEEPEMFAATSFREIHTGHFHQVKLQEHHGVRVRISPALCPPDAWHNEQTHVGNLRGAEAFVWHPIEGLINQALFTLPGRDADLGRRVA